MFLADFLFALTIAIFFTVIFTALSRRAWAWRRMSLFFVIIFLATWSGGIWISPSGDVPLGIYWISFFVAGLIFALVLETMAAASSRASRVEKKKIHQREEDIEMAVGTYFWILILVLAGTVIFGYIHRLHL